MMPWRTGDIRRQSTGEDRYPCFEARTDLGVDRIETDCAVCRPDQADLAYSSRKMRGIGGVPRWAGDRMVMPVWKSPPPQDHWMADELSTPVEFWFWHTFSGRPGVSRMGRMLLL
jgi:hypothetical protein